MTGTTPGGHTFLVPSDPPEQLTAISQVIALELDEFEDRIDGAEAAIANTSVAPIRRHLKGISPSQTLAPNASVRAQLAANTGDPGNPAAGAPGLTLDATGLVTTNIGGLFAFSLLTPNAAVYPIAIRRNGVVVARIPTTSNVPNVTSSFYITLVANDNLDLFLTMGNSSGFTWPANQTEPTRLDIVRLGA